MKTMKMAFNCNKISEERKNIQTYNWRAFGNNIDEPIYAINELIDNAYSACYGRKSTQIVDVEITKEDGKTYLYVKNNGKAINMKNLLDYANLSNERPSALNQFGTGFKTALSFLNPNNDDWFVFTKNEVENKIEFVTAPYKPRMKVTRIGEWPFDEKYTSVIKTVIEDEGYADEITEKELGFFYSLAIRKGLMLTLNGKFVAPIFPEPGKMFKSSNGEFVNSETIKKDVNINGDTVKLEAMMCVTDKNASVAKKNGDYYYTNAQNHQGVYLFANNKLITADCGNVISNKNGTAIKKMHPSLNGYIAIVNFILPGNENSNIPLVNCKNKVNWKKKVAQEYKKTINETVGSFFRTQLEESSEMFFKAQIKEAILKYVSGPIPTSITNGKEYEIAIENEYILTNDNIRADVVVGYKEKSEKSIQLQNVAMMYELKVKPVDFHGIFQLIGYGIAYKNRCEQFGVKPNPNLKLVISGPSIKESADMMLKHYQNSGVNIEFFERSC